MPEDAALAAIDGSTPGWGQEADPCYLGGWRCESCPVCPFDPRLSPMERAAALAARRPALPDVDASAVAALRAATGAGKMDATRALSNAGGDLDRARAALESWGRIR